MHLHCSLISKELTQSNPLKHNVVAYKDAAGPVRHVPAYYAMPPELEEDAHNYGLWCFDEIMLRIVNDRHGGAAPPSEPSHGYSRGLLQ